MITKRNKEFNYKNNKLEFNNDISSIRYFLTENYFSTSLFQEIVQKYFNTVFRELLLKHSIVEAKGLFVKNDEVKRDDFDMPYHIHILNGLIPSLLIYEHFLMKKEWINKEAELYIKAFILGYTFHDVNKLLDIDNLQNAIKELDIIIDNYSSLKIFFPEFENYKNDIYFLCLSDEDRTSVLANRYKLSLSEIHIKEVLSMLCKFADSVASNQTFDTVDVFYKSLKKSFFCIKNFNLLPLSYVEINPNPYILLSQSVLQSARSVLADSDKKVFQALRNGFVYFGEDLTENEVKQIKSKVAQVSEDIDPLKTTKIDAQKCSFGFIGSVNFTDMVLDKIINEYADRFWLLSPNGADKIRDFNEFVDFNEKLIEIYDLPISRKVQNNKLYLNIDMDNCDEQQSNFLKLFALHKIQWLNSKANKKWNNDFKTWQKSDVNLISEIVLDSDNKIITISSTDTLREYITSKTKSTNSITTLFKTYLNVVKTYSVFFEKDDDEIAEYIKEVENDIIQSFTGKLLENNFMQNFFDRFFNYKGNNSVDILNEYNPFIPEKKKMCAFTGGIGSKEYKEDFAFSMKARGFSNRTVTALNNNTNHISDLFSEENKLRKSQFNNKNANVVIYNDFFEATLDIDKDIFKACAIAKNFEVLEDSSILFDNNARFQYNLFNLNFYELVATKKTSLLEANFYYVRKHILLSKVFGIRSYVTGIMSPYQPHKEIFHYANAPKFLQQLGWDKVRLVNIDRVLDEISLVLTLGKENLNCNLLKISNSRDAYFSIYYLLKDDDKKKVYDKLKKFINNNPKLFSGMTVTEKLADLATNITFIGYSSSGSEETWLIRKALEFVRKEVKQGYCREDAIQRTCGSIYKSLRLDYVNTEAIKEFSIAVYDELFEKEWKGKLPNLNREKDWIYQFAFLYREKSLEKLDRLTAKKIREEMENKKLTINESSIINFLKNDNKEKYADKYIKLILNNK